MKTYDIKDAEVTGMSLVKAEDAPAGIGGLAFSEKEKWEDEPDYKTFRRKTYGGVGAPQGQIFIVIKLKTKDRELQAAKLIQGNKGEEVEKVVAQYLRAGLQDKYNV